MRKSNYYLKKLNLYAILEYCAVKKKNHHLQVDIIEKWKTKRCFCCVHLLTVVLFIIIVIIAIPMHHFYYACLLSWFIKRSPKCKILYAPFLVWFFAIILFCFSLRERNLNYLSYFLNVLVSMMNFIKDRGFDDLEERNFLIALPK